MVSYDREKTKKFWKHWKILYIHFENQKRRKKAHLLMAGLPILQNTMTYYHTQLLKISKQYYPKQHVIGHLIRARKFIDENFSENIDLDTISDFSFISKFHFIRLFRQCYGKTPHQYLTEKRIQLAKQLLQSNCSVAETCYKVGFDSTTSFAAIFKRYVGSSPSTFQKKQFSIA